MKKYIIISIAIICLLMTGCKKDNSSASSTPQGSIYGIVTDFASGDYVRHANVQLRPSGETTQTGYNGQYEFKNIEDGDYTIVVRKAEYSELIDDYVISVRDGRRMRRDVQIQKLPQMLQIVDNNQHPLLELDFGSYAGVSQKSFNLFNGGLVNLDFTITKTANWITQINPSFGTVNKGNMVTVSVIINRNLLSDGDNVTTIVVSTNAGGVELPIKARKVGGSINDLVIEVPGTNLMVQRADLGCYDWYSANAYCQNSNVANYNDWRLPTIDELEVLYNHRDFIGGFVNDKYWSSTKETYSDYYYYYNFRHGWDNSDMPSETHYVRAVRDTEKCLHYGDYNNYLDCWGLKYGGSDEWAVMFPSEITSQYSGSSISKVDAYLGETGSYTLKIYKEGTSEPNTLMKSQSFYVSSVGWNTITLSQPLALPSNMSVWISICHTYDAGYYPRGACDGIGNPNARWCYLESIGWYDAYDYNEGNDLCWAIWAYINNVKGEDGAEIQLPQTIIINANENNVKLSKAPYKVKMSK
jgi:hypothetical protein